MNLKKEIKSKFPKQMQPKMQEAFKIERQIIQEVVKKHKSPEELKAQIDKVAKLKREVTDIHIEALNEFAKILTKEQFDAVVKAFYNGGKQMIKKTTILLSLITATALYAKPIGPVNSSTGAVYPEGKLRAVLKNQAMEKKYMYDGSNKVDNINDQKKTIFNTALTLRYGIGHDIDIRANLPYKYMEAKQNNPKGQSFKMENQGIGDLMLAARYRLASQKDSFANFMIGAGIKLPTGSTNKDFHDSNIPGNPKGAVKPGVRTAEQSMGMQLGSGSTDYMLEGGMTKFIKNSRVDIYLQYMLKTEGSHSYEFGDSFKYNASYIYQVAEPLDLGIELNGEWKDKNKQHGVAIDSTGGNYIYTTPEIHWKINKRFDISLGVPILTYVDANYDSTTKKSAPVDDYRVITRFGFNFQLAYLFGMQRKPLDFLNENCYHYIITLQKESLCQYWFQAEMILRTLEGLQMHLDVKRLFTGIVERRVQLIKAYLSGLNGLLCLQADQSTTT
eukprot:TRINITY_DN9828_c0_g1_i1.p1 TRINITY_DN9828_c0_g1~~TRINITY_DN9828_c0_g1_i1.p1  ORF type:complete len:578 (+),score=21.07 TRINITY_DN9828_c0_g1_i1:231-1736(+)